MEYTANIYKLIRADGKFYKGIIPNNIGVHKKLTIYEHLDCLSARQAIAKGQYVKHSVFFKDEVTAIVAGFRT